MLLYQMMSDFVDDIEDAQERYKILLEYSRWTARIVISLFVATLAVFLSIQIYWATLGLTVLDNGFNSVILSILVCVFLWFSFRNYKNYVRMQAKSILLRELYRKARMLDSNARRMNWTGTDFLIFLNMI